MIDGNDDGTDDEDDEEGKYIFPTFVLCPVNELKRIKKTEKSFIMKR